MRMMWQGLARRVAAGIVFVAMAGPACAQETSSFPPLEASGAAPYVIGTEADLAASPSWTDLEALALKEAQLTRGAFTGVDGVKIHYRLYQHRAETRGGIVISTGRTEGLALYQETVRDLVRSGYSVYIHDHRGQGFSQRLLPQDDSIGHVENFDDYVNDLAAFVDGPVRAARAGRPLPLFLLAHSMGGAAAALFLEASPSARIAALALVTPMMAPWATGASNAGVTAQLADYLCDGGTMQLSGIAWLMPKSYAEGTPFDPAYELIRQRAPDAPNALTHSAARFKRHWDMRAQARCDGPDCGSPHAKVGGVSYRWFQQSCAAAERVRGEAAGRIRQPVLLLQGEQDVVVKPSAQKTFCDNLNAAHGAGYCVGRTVMQGKHSLLIEADAYRIPVLHRVLGFFDCVASGAARCE